MAEDLPPAAPPPAASTNALDAIVAALSDRVGGPDSDTKLGEALRMASRQARADGIRPEQLLVVLKRTFNEVTHATSDAGEDQRVNQLRELVTLCIKAYYS